MVSLYNKSTWRGKGCEMKVPTTIAKDIRTSGEEARYDSAVKNLLADRMILAWILKSCAAEFRDVEISEIAYRCIIGEPQVSEMPVMPDETNAVPKITGAGVEDVTLTEGTVVFDVYFDAVVPASGKSVRLIINVEAQNDFYPGYPLIKRSIYYCSRMISSQYGTVFVRSHYEKIKKVYSIWICMNPPKNRENTITGYSIREDNIVGEVKELPEYYDLITAVVICLGEPEGNAYEGVLKLLGVLLSDSMKASEKQKILEQEFDIPMTEKLERTVSEMCNLSEGVKERGRRESRLEAIESLMEKLKMTAKQAMDALSIPEEEQPKYMALIKR